ncbi:lipid phosphate phosphatase delta-like [Bidens hawaiensis]|uniref:lipid phosphate phosphatase delta-like n=1 Tax=Bidens hawaiensis TaxID=980011 RepID=UPI0040493573
MESSIIIPAWHVTFLVGVLTWVVGSSVFNVTHIVRSFLQPWVSRRVISGTPFILNIQKNQHGFWDAFFSVLSCVVSVPFYTGFLPLLFWSGHGKLARQMTLLMAFCDYLGNCLKDVVSAPRPKSPPVRILTATKDEKENALEYGLPSSHTLNTICLSGYLLHYIFSCHENIDASYQVAAFAFTCLFVCLIGLGRMYLGMHSLIDILGGLILGLTILAFWLQVHEYVDNFVILGKNVTSFWIALSFLSLFAYPTPEHPTPSFEFHTAFTGVTLGIVTGVQQTYHQFHHENVPRVFTPDLGITAFAGRSLVGIPTILLVKFCSKALAKWILPITASALGIPVRSSGYVPALTGPLAVKKSNEVKQSGGYLQKMFFSRQESFDVDTGIRLLQYAGLAWSVVDLVPSLFSQLNL